MNTTVHSAQYSYSTVHPFHCWHQWRLFRPTGAEAPAIPKPAPGSVCNVCIRPLCAPCAREHAHRLRCKLRAAGCTAPPPRRAAANRAAGTNIPGALTPPRPFIPQQARRLLKIRTPRCTIAPSAPLPSRTPPLPPSPPAHTLSSLAQPQHVRRLRLPRAPRALLRRARCAHGRPPAPRAPRACAAARGDPRAPARQPGAAAADIAADDAADTAAPFHLRRCPPSARAHAHLLLAAPATAPAIQ